MPRGPRRPRPPDDPQGRERAREALHRALDRGEDPEVAAREALRVHEECVEALLLLADQAVSPPEWRDRVRKAVETATQVMGRDGLEAQRGRLGATAEGADYLHALAALARTQLAEDRAAQAIQTLLGLLAMDPSDPVGVRADLLLLLLATGRDDEGEDLVAAYAAEASAPWLLGRALLRRRRALDAEAHARAGAALEDAIARFPEAARSLLPGAERRPGTAGADPILRQAFEDTEGALEWLAERCAAAGTATPAVTSPADPEADRRFSALESAEEAWEAEGARRAELAEQALAIWPDCAEAHRARASVTTDPTLRRTRLRHAVAAGCRALRLDPGGEAVLVGDGAEARSLLRARADLADALRAGGEEDAALAEERRLLAEDPDDPLGRGVAHAAALLRLGRDEEVAPLLDARAEDAGPGWTWLRVLAHWRAGRRVDTSFALAEATLVAPFVGPLLLSGQRRVPLPEGLSSDAVTAARRAAEALRPAYAATPGALAWLDERLPRPPPSSRRGPSGRRERG